MPQDQGYGYPDHLPPDLHVPGQERWTDLTALVVRMRDQVKEHEKESEFA